MMDEIDEAKASIEKQLEAAKALPSAYLREVFESPEAQKWEKKKLGEVIKLTQSGIWGEDPFRAPKEEIFTVIRSTEIDHKGTISIKDERVAQRRVKPETARKYFLKPNDLLIVRSGGTTGKIILGRVGLYLGEPDKYLFSNFLLKMRVDENLILPEFLWRYLNWDKFLEDNIPNLMRRTTGIQNLPIDEYFSILIPLPPLSEQKRIAAYLKEKIDQAEKLRETLEKELETLNTLPQSILSKAFRGEI
jgi:type I restriction enzyme S subunit